MCNICQTVKEDIKPIAGPGITRALTLVLYVLALGVFIGLWVFYSDKSQWVSKSLTLSEYSRVGFKCVPLQGMDLHGLTGTMMTYDDCLDTVEPVNATNVVKEDNDYVYKWTTGGVASYGGSSTTETVSSSTWEKEGYVCRSQTKDSTYGQNPMGESINYDECLKIVRPFDASAVVVRKACMIEGGNHCCCKHTDIEYTPFADGASFFKDTRGSACIECLQKELIPGFGGNGVDFGRIPTDEAKISSGFFYRDEGEVPEDTKNRILANGNSCFAAGTCSVCDHYKQDAHAPFKCTKTTSNDALPTTHDEAVTYYKKNYAPDALCAPLKENAPFQCTGSEPKSAVEILSLSFSNTELAFSVFGTLFVLILYKCKKAKDPDFSQEDELLDELAKLKADNAAIKADNAAMKKAMEEENAAMKKAMEEENAAMKSAMEATNEAIKRLEAGKA